MTTDDNNSVKCIPLSSTSMTSTECIPIGSTKCENGGGSSGACGNIDNEDFADNTECCNTNSEQQQQHCIPLCYPSSPAPLPADTPPSELLEMTRKLVAETLGTCLLVMIVVGSGISGESLSEDNVGIQLLINAIATTAGLYGLITILGPVSGAHFNPVVSMVDCLYNDMSPFHLCLYSFSQIIGGIMGSLIANIQYDIPFEFSTNERYGYNLWISEIIATVTLIVMIHGCIRTGQEASVPMVVSAWVGGGYFFTSSSIFANPAVTIGRMFTNTFAGIEPSSVPIYICFQLVGGLVGYGLVRFFYPNHTGTTDTKNMTPLKNDDVLYRRACILVNKDFFTKETY